MATAPDSTQIIAPRVPIVDPQTGLVSHEWYRFLYNLYEIAGAGSGVIPVSRGGTGNTTIPTDGQLLIGNGAGYAVSTLGGGTGITINNGAGAISIANDGVLTFSGGATGLTPFAPTAGAISLGGVLKVANGGTDATDAAGARLNLEAAKSGDNSDITSLTGLTGAVETPTYIQMETSPTVTMALGKIAWNDTDQTLDVGMDYNVVQQVGQEVYARVGNTTGVTIPNGTVVGFAGATSDALLVSPYLADGSAESIYILGIMTHDLPDSGDKGYCCTWGFVRGIDTSSFSAGDILYASPTVAGELVNTKPTAPDNVIPIAACLVSDATDGVIFVRPTIEQMQYYGVFAKTTDQSPLTINTEYLLTFDSAVIDNGVVIGTPTSRIVVPKSGLYQFEATVQLSSGSSSAKDVWFWFKKNGVDVPNSARIVTTDINNGYIPITLSEPISLAANDYVEMAFAADSTSVTVDTVAATGFAPAAPAIVLSVTQVQQ